MTHELQTLLTDIQALKEKHQTTLAEYDLGHLEDMLSDTRYTITNIEEQAVWDGFKPAKSEYDMHNTLNHAQQGTTR